MPPSGQWPEFRAPLSPSRRRIASRSWHIRGSWTPFEAMGTRRGDSGRRAGHGKAQSSKARHSQAVDMTVALSNPIRASAPNSEIPEIDLHPCKSISSQLLALFFRVQSHVVQHRVPQPTLSSHAFVRSCKTTLALAAPGMHRPMFPVPRILIEHRTAARRLCLSAREKKIAGGGPIGSSGCAEPDSFAFAFAVSPFALAASAPERLRGSAAPDAMNIHESKSLESGGELFFSFVFCATDSKDFASVLCDLAPFSASKRR